MSPTTTIVVMMEKSGGTLCGASSGEQVHACLGGASKNLAVVHNGIVSGSHLSPYCP